MEKPSPTFKWDKLALALDPGDETIGKFIFVFNLLKFVHFLFTHNSNS